MKPDTYVDGFVCAVPTARREEYRQHAINAARATACCTAWPPSVGP